MQKIAIFLILTLISLETEAQDAIDKISFDDSVRKGTLASGFTYYLRKNELPRDEISMHLVVRAGTENEDEQQLEIAHLLEHMAFAETTHFPDPYKYFQSKGLQIGREINAKTQLDATSFRLHHLPAKDTALIFNCLQFLRDCADGITLPRNKVAHECGTVLRELYEDDNDRWRAEAQYMSLVTGDRRYELSSAERKIINLKSCNYEALTRFYHTWYRPDRQGIIVAGDIDIDHMESLVHQIFGNLKKAAKYPQPITIKHATKASSDKTQFLAVTNTAFKEPVFQIYMKHPYKLPQVNSDYKELIIGALYNKLMERRRYRIVHQENSPLSSFSHTFQDRYYVLGADFSVLSSKLLIKPNRIKDAFVTFMTELERVRRYGFTELEVKSAKEELIQEKTTREAISSDEIVAGLEQHFVYQTPFPSNEDRKQLFLQLISSITNDDVNSKARSWIQLDKAIIVLLVSKNLHEEVPTQGMIRQWIDQISKADIKPEFDYAFSSPLMTASEISQLHPSKNIQRKEFKQIDVTHLLFPNGVAVYLRPAAKGSTHEVYISAFSQGGASVYSGINRFLAKHAAKVVCKSGLGVRSPSEVEKYALFKGVSLSVDINENNEKLFGRAKAENIEDLFQMIYLLFTQPGKDSSYLEKHIKQLKASKKSTTAFMLATIQATTITSEPDPDTYIDKFKFAPMYNIFRERFGNAGDFAFVISGDFQSDQIVRLLTKYLANLPSSGYRDETHLLEPLQRKSRVVKVFYGEQAGKDAHVQIVYPIPHPYSATYDAKIRTLAQVLQLVLTQKLRRETGGTYHVAVPFGRREGVIPNLTISFDCAPENANEMIKKTERVIKKIRSRGPDFITLEMAVEIEKRQVEKSLQSPLLFSKYLVLQLLHGQNLEEIMTIKATLQDLTSEEIKKLANANLKQRYAMQFTQLPVKPDSRP